MGQSLHVPRSGVLVLCCVFLSLVASSVSCNKSKPAKSTRPLSVIVSCDTAGWIVPCGCSSKQAGGLLRRATYAKGVAEKADVLLADAGGAPAGASPYDRSKFEAILAGELAMQVVAHNIGASEAELGVEYLRNLPSQLSALLLSSNLKDQDGHNILPTHRMVGIGGQQIAIFGVLSQKFTQPELKIDDPAETVSRLIAGLAEKHDTILVLAYLPEDELEAFASRVPEADLVVGGPTGQAIAPRRAGPTVWAASTNKGKFLIHLQRPTARGSAWDGEIVELGPEIPDDAKQIENLRAFREKLSHQDFSATQTSFVSALPEQVPGNFQVVGTEACRECHQSDCQQWSGSRHASAWQTLVEKKSHVDPYCQQCHTTGYGLPGGFTSLASGAERTSVGCESCHGPSKGHMLRSATRTLYDAKDRCLQCHDHENSPEFEYLPFWTQIAHGVSSRPTTEK